MILRSKEVRVVCKFDNLHSFTLSILANKSHSGGLQLSHHIGVDFVSMTMALMNFHLSVVQSECSAILGLQVGLSTAKTHGSTHVGTATFGHENDRRMRCAFIELSTVRPSLTKNVTREIDYSDL